MFPTGGCGRCDRNSNTRFVTMNIDGPKSQKCHLKMLCLSSAESSPSRRITNINEDIFRQPSFPLDVTRLEKKKKKKAGKKEKGTK